MLLRALLVSTAIVVSACGDGSTVSSSPSATSSSDAAPDESPSAEEAAEANLSAIEPAADARDQQVLVVEDGSIATLREVVDGDRPVLLWFWAPH